MKETKAEHRELEVKFDAAKVSIYDFKTWCWDRNPSRYLHVIGPDVYYRQGGSVLRHRQNGEGAGELTVKQRTSRSSTRDRLEIDLRFDKSTSVDDVTRFLSATGWKSCFTVVKDCHIFWFDGERPALEAVLYEARCISQNKAHAPQKYLEIEVHKTDSNHPAALTTLKDWESDAREFFELGETLDQSLYEIYSGRRYGLIRR